MADHKEASQSQPPRLIRTRFQKSSKQGRGPERGVMFVESAAKTPQKLNRRSLRQIGQNQPRPKLLNSLAIFHSSKNDTRPVVYKKVISASWDSAPVLSQLSSNTFPNLPAYRRMDPISVTASLITIIGVALAAAKQLEHLRRAFKDASGLLNSVTNEISDFRIVLGGCEAAINDLFANSNERNPATPLSDVVQIFERSTKLLEQLTELAASCIKEGGVEEGRVRANKVRWFRQKSAVKALQLQIRESKQDILALMESHSLYAISGMEVVIQQLSVDTGKFRSEAAEKLDHIVKTLSAQVTPIETLVSATAALHTRLDSFSFSEQSSPTSSTSSTSPALPISTPPYQALSEPRNPIHSQHGMDRGNMIHVQASCYKRTCRPWCSCRCHVRRNVKTPELMKGFMGSLFLGFAGMPGLAQTCNETQCTRPTGARVIVNYQFPEWFWTRALFASFMKNTMGSGPEMLIRVRNVIAFTSPTYLFCLSGNVEALQQHLRDGKASPYDIDSRGISLLHNALKFTIVNQPEICRLLIASGSDLYLEDNTGISAFHFAWDTILLEPNTTLKTKSLLELFPVDEGGLDERQFTRIHKCVLGIIRSNLQDELEISTSAINTPDNMGRTPLYWAASRGDEEAVTLLLQYGAKQIIPGCIKISPLHAAARGAHTGAAKLLLENGADVNSTFGEESMTPLHYAVAKNDGNTTVPYLLQHGANAVAEDATLRAPLLVALQNNMIETGRILLAHGANVDHKCEEGWTTLNGVIYWNEHESARLCLEYGAGYASNCGFDLDDGDSLLHITARYADVKMLRLLGDWGLVGLNVEHENARGETAEDVAVERGLVEGPEWKRAWDMFLTTVNVVEEEVVMQEKRRSSILKVGSHSLTGGLVTTSVVEFDEYDSDDDDAYEDKVFEDALEMLTECVFAA